MTGKRIKYGVCTVWLVFMIWFLGANRTVLHWLPSSIVEAQTNSQDKPVEQVRKNIQVLKGLPASQLFPRHLESGVHTATLTTVMTDGCGRATKRKLSAPHAG